ncbi:MAG: universal stress protein [Pseudonocardia sp.]|nr:universal stress protein [Pseudonocardia sp.]
MPIVAAYEDTPGGHDALVLGAQLARLTGLTAVVATVYPTDGIGLSSIARDPRWRQKIEAVARERFGRARAVIDQEWDSAEIEFASLGPGPAAPALVDHAEQVGAAVLVVGSTAGGLVGRLAPGKTVQRLLPTARCPIAIAPRGYRHFAEKRIAVIGVAYDGTPESDQAVVVAVHLASRTGAALRFVVVAQDPGAVDEAKKTAQKGVARVPAEIDTLVDVVVGRHVAHTLANLPERTDLLVAGSRGYRLMRRLLLGSVAASLVRSARYPVVVVPIPAE